MKVIKILLIAGLLSLTASCSNKIFQGHGQYNDDTGKTRAILLQWKAQTYHIPFIDAEVDYGSVSLQTECFKGGLLDHENNSQYGLIFKERPQDFKVVANAPKIKVGNFIVCAKLKKGLSLPQLNPGDSVTIETFCAAKPGIEPIMAANPEGYTLAIKVSEKETSIDCNGLTQ